MASQKHYSRIAHRRGGARRWPLVVLLVIALAIALRITPAMRHSLWTDELTTLEVIAAPWRDIGHERLSRGHYPTYFWLLKTWCGVFGNSHLALRAPSTLANLLTIAALVLLVRIAFSSRLAAVPATSNTPDSRPRPPWTNPFPIVAAAAAAFFVMHQRSVWSAVEARPYALTLLCVVLSQAALLRLLTHGPRVAAGLLYLLATLGALLSHASALPALATQPLFALLAPRVVPGASRPGARAALGLWGVAAGSGATGAVVLAMLSAAGSGGAAANLGPGYIYEALAHLFVGEFKYLGGSSLRHVGAALAVALTALAIWNVWRRGGSGERLLALLAVMWLAGPLVVLPILQALGKMGETYRYLTPAAPGAVLLAALAAEPALRRARAAFAEEGLRGLRTTRGLQAVPALGYVLFVAAVGVAFAFSPGDGVRAAVQHLAANIKPRESLVVCTGGDHGKTILDYYGPIDAPAHFFDREQTDAAKTAAALREATAGHDGFWVMLYKAEDSPVLECARALAAGYQRVEKWRRGEVELHRFALAPGAAENDTAHTTED